MDFFERFTALCKEEGGTTTGVGQSLGYSKATVGRWRYGSIPSADALTAIAEHFGVSVDYLLGNTDIKNPPDQQSPEEIAKVALFGGDGEVTDEMWNDEIERNNIEVYLGSMPAAKSASANIGDDYYIALDEQSLESTAEARCRLAHEAGHCITGSFYNLYAPLDRRSKHERRADKWAVKKLIPKAELEAQLRQGLEPYELAEYFNVTEEFIHKALEFYFECGIA